MVTKYVQPTHKLVAGDLIPHINEIVRSPKMVLKAIRRRWNGDTEEKEQAPDVNTVV